MRPLIGITGDYNIDNNSISLNSEYYWAIYKAGGQPLIIPYIDVEDAGYFVSVFDGIMFTGGNDIDPVFYGEALIQSLVRLTPSETSLN